MKKGGTTGETRPSIIGLFYLESLTIKSQGFLIDLDKLEIIPSQRTPKSVIFRRNPPII